ncbi:MAG: SBBP repeat-containing protein [Terriglobia bacterium]
MNTQQVTLFPYRLLKGRLARAAGFLSVAGLLAGCLFSAAFPSAVRAASEASSPQRAKSSPRRVDAATKARLAQDYGRLPMSFETNQGQTDAQVKFLSRGRGYQLFLTQDEAVLSLKKPAAGSPQSAEKGSSPAPDMLRMKVVGANAHAELEGQEKLPGISNYFIGRDPSQWHTQIPNYRQVAMKQVYPGIDLVYYGQGRQLEYDFVVAPGADPKRIVLAIDSGTTTGHSPHIDADGDLVVALDGGEVRFHRPAIYQMSPNSGDRTQVEGRYVLRASKFETGNSKLGNPKSEIQNPKWEVGFEIASYDATRPLIIDPVLAYSTYLGGNLPGTPGFGIDAANGIAVDSTGSAFIVGETDSTDFPTAHALQPETGGPLDFPDDAFVSKISPDGQTLVYSTYLGGSKQDQGSAIAVDTFGSAYVTGTTVSPDFPHSFGAADPNCGNDGQCDATLLNGLVTTDAFITKLNPEGSALEYSTFFSHLGPELFDSDGNPVLGANGLPVFLGANDRGLGIAVDNNRNAYVTGTTDFAEPSLLIGPGGDIDAWVLKVDPSGANFISLSDLGGSRKDMGLAITADNSGNAYVSGFTLSPDFPTLNAFQPTIGGNSDAFVTKVNTNAGSGFPGSLSYSTYLGGDGNDSCCGPDPSHPGKGIAVDTTGKVYVTGVTNSTTSPFPTTPGAYQTSCTLNALDGCDSDAFVAKLDTTLSGAASLVYSTYLGGSGADGGVGIAVDVSGNAYITGITTSPDFPIWPTAGVVFQPNYGGGNADAFVTQLNTTGTGLVYSSFLGGSNTEDGRGIAVDTRTPASAFVTGQTCSTDFPTARPLQELSAGNCDAFVSKVVVGPDIALSPAALSFSSQEVGTTSAPQTITITSNGDSPLTISAITVSGEFAETDNCTGVTLTKFGDKCTINVTFSPTTTGPKSGTATITDNALGSPHSVPLSGGTSGVTGDFSLSSDPTASTVSAGGSTSFNLTVTPANGFTGKVNLTCTGVPSAATCSVIPTSITLDGQTPQTAAVNISTTARVMAPPVSGPNHWLPRPAVRWAPWLLPLLLLAIMGATRRYRTSWVLAAMMLVVVLWSACGGGGTAVGVPSGTPAGTYVVTITGTSGSSTHAKTVSLTVQ